MAPRAGKMKRCLCSDWLPERARRAYLAGSGLPALYVPAKAKFFGVILIAFGHIINPFFTKLVRSKWLDIGLFLFLRFYGPRLRLDP